MRILSAVGAAILWILKWLAKAALGLLYLVLEAMKVILLLFGLVARIFFAFARAATP